MQAAFDSKADARGRWSGLPQHPDNLPLNWASVLLEVPVDVAVGHEKAANVLGGG
jgi:hypothetical protein